MDCVREMGAVKEKGGGETERWRERDIERVGGYEGGNEGSFHDINLLQHRP